LDGREKNEKKEGRKEVTAAEGEAMYLSHHNVLPASKVKQSKVDSKTKKRKEKEISYSVTCMPSD
jgi:hypothetical protein